MNVGYPVLFDSAPIPMEQIKEPPLFWKQFQSGLQLCLSHCNYQTCAYGLGNLAAAGETTYFTFVSGHYCL